MKKLFSFIAFSFVLCLICLSLGVALSLYLSKVAGTICYILAGVFFTAIITMVIVGYISSAKNKSKKDNTDSTEN